MSLSLWKSRRAKSTARKEFSYVVASWNDEISCILLRIETQRAKRTFPPRNIALPSLHRVAGPFNYAATNWQFIHRHRDTITYAVSLSLTASTIYPSASTNFSIENLQTNTLHTCALPVLAIIKQFIRPTLLWNKIKLFINKQSTQLFLPSYTKMIVIVRMQHPITFTPRCIQICNNIHRETRHECAV